MTNREHAMSYLRGGDAWERDLLDRQRDWEQPSRRVRVVSWTLATIFCGVVWVAVLRWLLP